MTQKQLQNSQQVLENAEGEAQRMRETINTGLVGAFNEMRSAAESALLSIGEAGVFAAMTKSMDRARDALRFFDRLPGVFRAVVAGALLLGPALIAAGVGMRLLANATQHATLAALKQNAIDDCTTNWANASSYNIETNYSSAICF